MTAIPIADFLTSFTAPSDAFAATAELDDFVPEDEPPPMAPPEPEELAEERLEEARLSGVREGEAAAAASFERVLAAERANAEQRLAAERARWVHAEGERLMQGLHNALEQLEGRLAEQVCRILHVFLPAKLREGVIGNLRENLAVLLRGETPRVIRISGPADLLNEIRDAAAATAKSIEFVETDDPEVSIVADDTTISSLLQVWEERLGGAES